ncbi:MAG: hypothetical protein K0R08_1469 [Solimicrobium sp.]|nr:hypothetical protein [Solimicrobium sp.]
MDSAGSYLEISKVLEGYKSYFNAIIPHFIDDSLIALWIKEIISGSDKLSKIDDPYYKMMCDHFRIDNLKVKLVGVTYLLFGCEVARNLASIPIHHMMLELIINKELSLKDALTPTDDNKL